MIRVPYFPRLLYRSGLNLINHDGMLFAATLAYTTLLAIFPFIIFLTSLTGFFSQTEAMQKALDYFFRLAPREVSQVLYPVIREILSGRSGGLLTFGILGSLWITVSAMETLRSGLNRVYDVAEKRPAWKRYAQSLLFVLGLTFSLGIVSVILPLGPVVFGLLLRWFHLDAKLDMVWNISRYVISLGVLLFTIGMIYRFIPNIRQRLREVMPGALIATGLWILLASFFSLYISHAHSYSITYGSLSGIIIALFFFQITALILLFGAELNQTLRTDDA
jgi:membrane protein